MSDLPGPGWRRRVVVAASAALAGLLLVSPATAGAPTPTPSGSDTSGHPDLGRLAGEATSVVEVLLADSDELDRLVATGVDLDHHVSRTASGIVVHAVVTPNEVATLRASGYRLGEVLFTPADSARRIAERDATIAAHAAENEALRETQSRRGAQAPADVKIIRADYYTSGTDQVLSVEAKWAQGQTATDALTVTRDSGPGTPMGSGGTQTISRFVDAGVYLYHRGASTVTARPNYIQITSPSGDVAVAKVNQWLPIPRRTRRVPATRRTSSPAT
ncbi:hypothetical protein [Plantactinospora veratri]